MKSVKEIMDEMFAAGVLSLRQPRCGTCKPDCAGRHTTGSCDMRCGCKQHDPQREEAQRGAER